MCRRRLFSELPRAHGKPWRRALQSLTRATAEIKTYDDLLPPGAKPGTVPRDIEHATGLERLEILGKMQGIDIFDMKPLDASRVGMSRSMVTGELRGSGSLIDWQVPLRTPLSSTAPATSSMSAALAARLTPTTSSGLP